MQLMISSYLKKIILLKRFPDRFPVTIIPKNLYIFPNRFGLFFIVVLLVMLAGSVNYHNNLGYMMTFLLGGIYLMSFHITHKNLKGLMITKIETKPVFEGDDVSVVISLINPGHERINLSFEISGFGKIDCRIIESGFSVIKITKKTDKRGVSLINEIVVQSDFPLGLTRTWTYILPENLEIIVYPRPILTTETPFSVIESGVGGGEGGGSKKGADDFSELKDYVPGDPMQRIAWKSLSRGHGLLTKYFNGSQAPLAYMIELEGLSADSKENKLGKIAYLITESESKKKKYGLSLSGKKINPSYGETHMHECLRALAEYR